MEIEQTAKVKSPDLYLGTVVAAAINGDPSFVDRLFYFLQPTLTEREWTVLRLRYSKGGKTLLEIGQQFGVTGARIGQIEKKALRRLRGKIIRTIRHEHSAEMLERKYAPTIHRLLSNFRKTCQHFSYPDMKAVANALEVDTTAILDWQAGRDTPKLLTILAIMRWEKQGKPIAMKKIEGKKYHRAAALL